MKKIKTSKVLNIINSLLIALQLIISFVTFRYVIIPGAELLVRDEKIDDLEDKVSSLQSEKMQLSQDNMDLIYNIEKNRETLEEQHRLIHSQEIMLESLSSSLLSAELTILLDDFLPYIKSVPENEYLSNQYWQGLNNLFDSIYSETTVHNDEEEAVQAETQRQYYGLFYMGVNLLNLEQAQTLAVLLEQNLTDTEFYSNVIATYTYMSDDFYEPLASYQIPQYVSQSSYNLLREYITNKLNENKHLIDHINDSKFSGLLSLWNEYLKIINKYMEEIPEESFLTYDEYLDGWSEINNEQRRRRNEEWARISQIEHALAAELKQLPSLYDYVKKEFVSHGKIVDEILLDGFEIYQE